jgi:eukaryotic-like serine/threonine-protein kinase
LQSNGLRAAAIGTTRALVNFQVSESNTANYMDLTVWQLRRDRLGTEGDRLHSDRPSEHVGTSPGEPVVMFGLFALNLQTGELTKNGVKIRLQNKPFQILKALVEHPGRVVTRDELKLRLWPENTFVDFESGLNTAANRLRLALCDSAEDPRYIETLPRVGYRFIAELRTSLDPSSAHSVLDHERTVLAPISPAVTQAPGRTGPFALLSHRPFLLPGASLLLLTVFVGGAFIWPHIAGPRSAPVFLQLTFLQGTVSNARFTGTGEVIYGAKWNGRPRDIYLMDVASPESRKLGFSDTALGAVSRSSKLAILRNLESGAHSELDVSPLHGGVPRAIDKDVMAVDWAPDGVNLCLVRERHHEITLEYPAGKTIYKSSGWLGQPRLSPDGSRVAVVEHPLREDDGGRLLLLDRNGRVRRLSEDWASISGVAWRPSGSEIWFAAAKQGLNREIYAVSLNGRLRRVASMAAALDLFDISTSGRVLIGRSVSRLSMYIGETSHPAPKDISWLDWSRAVAFSADGNTLLFDESGEGGGPLYTVYLHHRKEGTTERIGNGRGMDLSADGNWILAGSHNPSSHLNLISVRNSQVKMLCAPGLIYQSARFVPNSRSILVQANEEGKPVEMYLQDLDSGKMHKIPDATGMYHAIPSPDGKRLAAYMAPDSMQILDLNTGAKSSVALSEPAVPVGWASARELIVEPIHGVITKLEKLNLVTHQLQVLDHLSDASDPSNANRGQPLEVVLSSDLKTFAYSRLETSTGLFAVDGWS